MIYDTDHDVIVEFGGTSRGRAISDTYVFCLSAGTGAAYGCTDPAHLNKWIRTHILPRRQPGRKRCQPNDL